MNPIIILSLILILSVGLPFLFNFSNTEGYSNYSLDQSVGNIPDSQTNVIVQDIYPPIGGNQLSNNTSNDIWWHFPTFQVSSYAQITNNIKYPNNPDEGTCMPASMCGALYKKKILETIILNNYLLPLIQKKEQELDILQLKPN